MEGRLPRLPRNACIIITTVISLAIQITAQNRQSDGWGPWQAAGECSRKCGGGVQLSTRRCMTGRSGSASCQGSRTTYQSCNTQECPDGTQDFREYQCSSYNSVPTSMKGRREQTYNWTPYFDPNFPCDLICQNEYGDTKKLRDTTIDGTPCDSPRSFGICINGFCKPTGCDHKIGSVLGEDKCLVCGGSGEDCETLTGSTLGRRLNRDDKTGVVSFPVGATYLKIVLTSMFPSTLEHLRSETRVLLELETDNGRTAKLTDTTFTFGLRKMLDLAGTTFTFIKNRDVMTFTARGPVNATLHLNIRFHGVSPLVEYEYSRKLQKDETDEPQAFTAQRYTWRHGPWTQCSATCGHGEMLRGVVCMDRTERKTTKDEMCPLAQMPDKRKACNLGPCKSSQTLFKWTEGRWGECNVNCGVGEQTRNMMCVESGATESRASDELCARYAGQKPVVKRACRGRSDECPQWVSGHWTQCSVTCGRGVQTRQVTCQQGGPQRMGDDPVMLADDRCPSRERPEEQQDCVKHRCDPRNVETTNTTTTTTTTTTRTPRDCRRSRYGCCPDNVTPARGRDFLGCKTTRTSQDLCELSKDRGRCSNYTVKWYFNRTSKACQRFWYGSCGGNDNRFEDRESCISRCLKTKIQPEGCSTSVFGCCGDNRTFARGENKRGCPETRLIGGCAGTQHGCCRDGVTSASGPRMQGCPETPVVVGGCAGTQHGCCRDGVTSASGPSWQGCPDVPFIGGCAGTRHGCCLDGTTAASGPRREGCPELTSRPSVGGCRGTRFGCCRDGKTIARGDNYLGCEENPMVRCRRMQYGCCQDGTTPARGPNKEGCPETMVKEAGCGPSRYGCCPDGATFAQGPDQEGCPDFSTEFCGYPKDPGGCSDYSRQWFYDVDYGYCRQFWYGGCKGNANRFQSKEECQEKCVNVTGKDRCNLPMVKGPCKRKMNRYYFDVKERQCKPFVYGGCRSNPNNFMTGRECRAACSGNTVTPEVKPRSACASNPCQKGFPCIEMSNGSYKCQCSGDWGTNCEKPPPPYWCFSDSECGGSKMMCYKQRVCAEGDKCRLFANCTGKADHYACTKRRCPEDKDCVHDDSTRDGYACIDKIHYTRPSPVVLDCNYTIYGCCDDRKTPATTRNKLNCYRYCQFSEFGCCPDEKTKAKGPDYEGCPVEGSGDVPCERTEFGCCPDGVTYAQGYRNEGCEDTTDTERVITRRPVMTRRPVTTPRPTVTRRPETGGPDVSIVKCTAAVKRRRCTEYTVKWRYNTSKRRCERFWWGGCRDNGNVFETERDCDDQCRRQRPVVVTTPPTEPDFVNICDMPGLHGRCKGIMRRFYYETKEGRCKVFLYGGCGGNENNFLSMDECRKECMKGVMVVTTPAPTEKTLPPPSKSSLRISGSETVEEFSPLRLRCQYQGSERVNIDWFKDGQQQSRTSRTDIRLTITVNDGRRVELHSELTIRSAMMADAGTYLCRSSSGSVQSKRVTMVGKTTSAPRPDRPTTRRPIVTAQSSNNMSGASSIWQGETITITCTARGPRRPTSMEWFINGRIVNPNVGTAKVDNERDREDRLVLISTLSIPNAGENNEGTYYCRSRPYGDLQKMAIKVLERGAPVTRAPVTRAPVTRAPVTRAPVTRAPVTRAPVTRAPVTRAPVTRAPVTRAPVTRAPVKPDTEEDVCMMPERTGRCRASFPRWRYNHLEGRCTQFIYGGCDGNSNNFETEEACERYCQPRDICYQPKKVGRCRASMPRFHFNSALEKCTHFIFGGCSPNANNFMSMSACERKCGQYIKRSPTTNNNTTRPDGGDVCEQMPEKGTCRGYNIKWYYSKSRNECSRFVYTGCDGNGNRFDTENECESRCVRSVPVIPVTRRTRPPFQTWPTSTTTTMATPNGGQPAQCMLESSRGSCTTYTILWYYDAKNRRCLRFYYGGCGGNENRFATQSECENVCMRSAPVRPVTPRPTQRPVSCQYSTYGCCSDEVTFAVDRQRSNCPAPVRPVTPRPTQRPVSCQYSTYGCCSDGVTFAVDRQSSNCQAPVRPVTPRPTQRPVSCQYSTYGCCSDGVTFAVDRPRSNCQVPVTPRPTQRPVPCQYSTYRCCSDGVTAAADQQRSNCRETQPTDNNYNKVMARSAADVTLQCPMRGNGVSWYREGFILAASDRFVMNNNGTLVLRELTEDMAGYYACRYTGSNNRPQLERFKVEISRPLTILPGPTDINLKPGQDGFLHCQAFGIPTPSVTWRRDGQTLRTTTRHKMFRNGTLMLSNAQPHDQGRYVCVAENEASQSVSRSISLTITESLKASIGAHAGVYLEGDTITLKCEVSGYPQPSMLWAHEGRRIGNENRRTVREGELVVRSATIEDAGLYKCEARNDKGSIEDFTTVQIHPQTPGSKCVDTMRPTKCGLIVAGRLCGFRMFSIKCCQSCRRHGYL